MKGTIDQVEEKADKPPEAKEKKSEPETKK
jgi:hypothetical protein